jgi:hypothetical protein
MPLSVVSALARSTAPTPPGPASHLISRAKLSRVLLESARRLLSSCSSFTLIPPLSHSSRIPRPDTMARKFFVGGNFKMNPASIAKKKEILAVLNEATLDPAVGARAAPFALSVHKMTSRHAEVVVAPPTLYLLPLKEIARKEIALAAQNCYSKASGAFTGEIRCAIALTSLLPSRQTPAHLSTARRSCTTRASRSCSRGTPSGARSSTSRRRSWPRRRAPRSTPG